jgi:methylglutaconyl-CoA hydratase
MTEPTDQPPVRVERDGRGVATVTMDRPATRNAFDERLVAELRAAADRLAADPALRVVVLTGAGEVFSAGADLAWMRAMKDYTYEENLAEARALGAMYRALYELPQPLIGRVNGHALGGGTGLVAVCDIAIAADAALFGFTEVTLGLAPAVIAPYVVRKVGRSFARALFVTGERFDASRARAHGLVHEVVPADGLDDAVADAVTRCLRGGPHAAATAKRIPDLALGDLDDAAPRMAELIAGIRVGDEAQAGMTAFLERRLPPWSP